MALRVKIVDISACTVRTCRMLRQVAISACPAATMSSTALSRKAARSLASPQGHKSGKGRGSATGDGIGWGATSRREGRGSYVKHEPTVQRRVVLRGEATSGCNAETELGRAHCDTEDEKADMPTRVGVSEDASPEDRGGLPSQSADAAAGGPAQQRGGNEDPQGGLQSKSGERDDREKGFMQVKVVPETEHESARVSVDASCADVTLGTSAQSAELLADRIAQSQRARPTAWGGGTASADTARAVKRKEIETKVAAARAAQRRGEAAAEKEELVRVLECRIDELNAEARRDWQCMRAQMEEHIARCEENRNKLEALLEEQEDMLRRQRLVAIEAKADVGHVKEKRELLASIRSTAADCARTRRKLDEWERNLRRVKQELRAKEAEFSARHDPAERRSGDRRARQGDG